MFPATDVANMLAPPTSFARKFNSRVTNDLTICSISEGMAVSTYLPGRFVRPLESGSTICANPATLFRLSYSAKPTHEPKSEPQFFTSCGCSHFAHAKR